jgi:hypothetical protein
MQHSTFWVPKGVKYSDLSAMRKLGDGREKNSLNIESKVNFSWGSFRLAKRSIFPRGNKSGIFFEFYMIFAQK